MFFKYKRISKIYLCYKINDFTDVEIEISLNLFLSYLVFINN